MKGCYLKLNQVLDLIGVAQTDLFSMIDKGKFPRQSKLGLRLIGWRSSEVHQWVRERAL